MNPLHVGLAISCLFLDGEPASPESGEVLRARIEVDSIFEQTDSRYMLHGEDVTNEDGPAWDFSTKRSLVLEVRDEIEKTNANGVDAYRRTFESIEATLDLRPNSSLPVPSEGPSEFVSPLENEEVRFVRSEDGFTAEPIEESTLRSEDLESLEADLSFAFLLPQDGATRGDEWEVEPNLIARLLVPGGDMKLRAKTESAPSLRPDTNRNDDFTGDIKLRHAGREWIDGEERVLFAIDVDVGLEMERELDAAHWAPEPRMKSDARYVGKGRIEWHPKERRIERIRVELELEREISFRSGLGDDAGLETIMSETGQVTFSFNRLDDRE